MKKLFIIEEGVSNVISYWLLAGFLVMLPFDFFYSEIILACFAVHTLIHFKREYLRNLFRRQILWLISIYLIGIISVLYSPDKLEGLNIATRQLAILLFPVLLACNGLHLEKYKLHFISFFILTCTCAIMYLYFDAIHTLVYFHFPFSKLFTLAFMNHNFSLPIEMHATYLSLYVAFSVIALTYLWVMGKGKVKGWKLIYPLCMLILTMGLLQLSSRAVFIGLLIVMNIVFPFVVIDGNRRKRFLSISLLSSAIILLGILSIDSFKTRYISELKKDLSQRADLVEINESRMARWNAIFALIRRSPVIGYGMGGEKKLLKEKYFQEKLYTAYLNEFNTHNEYLSFLLKNGIFGLAIFIFVLYQGFAASWRRRDPLFISFMILISIICISENLLDLNKGIFFYSFFFSLFLIGDSTAGYENKGIAL